ncbi:MAG: hypothetical protein ACFFCI_02160 [Promethearchaeota archaeon]
MSEEKPKNWVVRDIDDPVCWFCDGQATKVIETKYENICICDYCSGELARALKL